MIATRSETPSATNCPNISYTILLKTTVQVYPTLPNSLANSWSLCRTLLYPACILHFSLVIINRSRVSYTSQPYTYSLVPDGILKSNF